MTKLEGKGRSGDMVHASMEMSKDVGFKCVSRIWYNQTQAIGDGIDQILDSARSRDDILCPIKHMRLGLNGDNKVVLEYLDGREFLPTEHALQQMAKWHGVPQGFLNTYLSSVYEQNGEVRYERDEQDAGILLSVFKNGIRDGRVDPEKQFRYRTYSDGTLRAMLSERYAIIDNVWYLETLQKLFKEIGGDEPRLSHWKGDADTIFGNILLPDTCREEKDSDYGGMLSVSNCEIGTRRLSQMPSVFRAICMNGCIWDQESGNQINKVHRGKIDLNDLRERIVNNLNDQIPLLSDGVTRFLAMREKVVDKSTPISNIFAVIAKENSMSVGGEGQAVQMVTQFRDHESDNYNLFGIVNSITRTGQQYENKEWVRFDSIAGLLMNYGDKQWEGLQNRAKYLDVKDYNKVYGIVAA
jgi:hypothetical protein